MTASTRTERAAEAFAWLRTWLEAEGWTKPPPKQRKGGRVGGRASGDGLPRSNGRKVDLCRLGLCMAGYIEREDGTMYHPDGHSPFDWDWEASQ